MRILMVCLGNICRSPLAEGLLASKTGDAVFVDSAGTSAEHQGELPDPRSIEVATKNGLDITYQRSRPFRQSDFDDFDLIFAMDASNYNNIRKLARNEGDMHKVKLILNEVHPGENRQVPDPWYGGKQGFDDVFEMLDLATDKIIENYL